MKELATLPNGLPLYKLMQYKVTKEQCKIIKVNPEHTKKMPVYDPDTDMWEDKAITIPLTVRIKINRITAGIEHVVYIDEVFPIDLIVWNEKMTPDHIITYRNRKRKTRTVMYYQTIR